MDIHRMLRIVEAYIEQEKGLTVTISPPQTQRELTLLTRAFAKADLMLLKKH